MILAQTARPRTPEASSSKAFSQMMASHANHRKKMEVTSMTRLICRSSPCVLCRGIHRENLAMRCHTSKHWAKSKLRCIYVLTEAICWIEKAMTSSASVQLASKNILDIRGRDSQNSPLVIALRNDVSLRSSFFGPGAVFKPGVWLPKPTSRS